jgi:hypothetical protein
MHLVLLETSGNQNYIFSTNKLKENIGASELTYRAGTKCVLDAVGEIRTQASLWSSDSEQLRSKLLDKKQNPAIEAPNTDRKVEVVIATSGKALLLVSDRKIGKAIVRQATHAVLRDCIGVDLCGVISDEFEFGAKGGLANAIAEVHRKFDSVRAKRPSPDLRFLRLPIIDECATSGLPASKLGQDTSKGELRPYSAVSIAKRNNHTEGENRIAAMLERYDSNLELSESLKFAESEATEWLAIVHADGNGLGEIFLSFDKHLQNLDKGNLDTGTASVSDRSYVMRLREFSIALDICTEKAFVTALKIAFPEEKYKSLPIAPLVLGGDDLTVVCDAKYALEFIVQFLKEFEKETSAPSQKVGAKEITIIPKLAKVALGINRLSSCAGIAIVKPHFPFSVAYHLAEQLLKTAKTVKTKVTNPENENKPYPCSAIDFHILYDSSGTDLDTIRQKQQVDNKQTYLYNSPYVVTDLNKLQEANGQAWASRHDWDGLYTKAKALKPDPESASQLTSGQVHALRSHLYMGKEATDGYYKLIKSRYDFQNLLDSEDSLFAQDAASQIHTTSLLDAMDVMPFLDFNIKSQKSENSKTLDHD